MLRFQVSVCPDFDSNQTESLKIKGQELLSLRINH